MTHLSRHTRYSDKLYFHIVQNIPIKSFHLNNSNTIKEQPAIILLIIKTCATDIYAYLSPYHGGL